MYLHYTNLYYVDPTGGASISEDAKWVLDEASLQDNIKKILSRFCGTLTFAMMDTNSIYLTTASVPPVFMEWWVLSDSVHPKDWFPQVALTFAWLQYLRNIYFIDSMITSTPLKGFFFIFLSDYPF